MTYATKVLQYAHSSTKKKKEKEAFLVQQW